MIFRLLRLPRTLWNRFADGWLWPLWLRAQGVDYGTGLKLVGRPEIRQAEHGVIKLGDQVSLYSRPNSNPLQLHSPCALYTLAPGAQIHIGSQTAMSGAVICAATSVKIGERVLIGANVKILDTDFHPLNAEARKRDRNAGATTRPITIGNDVFIGTGALILRGTIIGDGCVVGAGAVVSGTFPPASVIAGNPAKNLTNGTEIVEKTQQAAPEIEE
ncbi:MAG: acyltransferase [Anaerolineae bacterium]|nr:acyltransferase [Anaerolineae bacterium]